MSFIENLLVYEDASHTIFPVVAHLRRVGLDGVVNVDEDKEDGDEQGHPEPRSQHPFSIRCVSSSFLRIDPHLFFVDQNKSISLPGACCCMLLTEVTNN